MNFGKTSAEQISKPVPSFRSYLPDANRDAKFLTPTYQEIRDIISNLRNGTPGHDGISFKIVHPVIETLLPP